LFCQYALWVFVHVLTDVRRGEGFIALTRSFNRAIEGLSSSDGPTYLQVFLTIAIMYLTWSLLFARFNKKDPVGQRQAKAWELIHFPLHFGLLLLLGAMVVGASHCHTFVVR